MVRKVIVMYKNKKILAIIPARMGSKRIKQKMVESFVISVYLNIV